MIYDIFISYKHSDENGKVTHDYDMAKRLFCVLSDMGYRVFFSSMSLETLGSSRYKADIDAALDTARVMTVVLSKAEYANSQWVQYEWDSFYNDYLSGARREANLFTLTSDVNIHDLPRTLRNVQNFPYSDDLGDLCGFIRNALPNVKDQTEPTPIQKSTENRIKIISGREVTNTDIEQAVDLDGLVYDDVYHVDPTLCEEWVKANPDIYVMAKDKATNKIIAYVNISPVTEECYEKLKNGDFIDTGITSDMILSYTFIADDLLDMDGYMGHIRVNSENYRKFDGTEIDEAIQMAIDISGEDNLSRFDPEYERYTERRKEYFASLKAEKKEPKSRSLT